MFDAPALAVVSCGRLSLIFSHRRVAGDAAAHHVEEAAARHLLAPPSAAPVAALPAAVFARPTHTMADLDVARFFRAHKGNVSAAAAAIHRYIEWRRASGADEVCFQLAPLAFVSDVHGEPVHVL